ncbi:MAG: DMT family transporter [Pseudomonadota bacterium]
MQALAKPGVAISFFVIAMGLIPLNDAIIKLMSGSMSIFQIMALRALTAVILLLALPGTFKAIKNLRLKTLVKLVLRSLCLVGAMLLFFLPLATLNLAETTAIFFLAPLLISVFSVPILGEKLGPYRMLAILIGICGVLLIVKPGTDGFQYAYIMPVGSACCYAAYQLFTRYLRNETNVLSMVIVVNFVYFIVGVFGVIAIFAIAPAVPETGVYAFLLRGWEAPDLQQSFFFLVTAIIVLNLAFASTNAYSNVEAALVAPFEYVALPMAVFWGIIFWGDWPDLYAWAGIALIFSGGIFLIYRENLKNRDVVASAQMRASAVLPEKDPEA